MSRRHQRLPGTIAAIISLSDANSRRIFDVCASRDRTHFHVTGVLCLGRPMCLCVHVAAGGRGWQGRSRGRIWGGNKTLCRRRISHKLTTETRYDKTEIVCKWGRLTCNNLALRWDRCIIPLRILTTTVITKAKNRIQVSIFCLR